MSQPNAINPVTFLFVFAFGAAFAVDAMLDFDAAALWRAPFGALLSAFSLIAMRRMQRTPATQARAIR
jgi:hypothetical protein